MFRPSPLVLSLLIAWGAAQAQTPAQDSGVPAATSSRAISPVEKEAAQRGSPAANTGQGMRYGNSTYSEGVPDLTAECRPAGVHCPIVEPNKSSGSSVISTDSLPLGSTNAVERGAGGPVESQYPTAVGSGRLGSGSTGSPAGPGPGPTNGIGR